MAALLEPLEAQANSCHATHVQEPQATEFRSAKNLNEATLVVCEGHVGSKQWRAATKAHLNTDNPARMGKAGAWLAMTLGHDLHCNTQIVEGML